MRCPLSCATASSLRVRTSVNPDLTNNDLPAVCNLLTGTFDVLPWIEHEYRIDDLDKTGYSILTGTMTTRSSSCPSSKC